MIQDFRIGAGELFIDGVSCGHTTQEGVVVNYEPNIHLHKSGKFGDTPVKASLIGQNLTVQITMAETTADNMENAFAGVVSADDKIKFGGVAGREIAGKEIKLIPFDGTETWVFRNAVPTSNVEIAYQVDNERVYQITYTAMVEVGVPEDENIAYFS